MKILKILGVLLGILFLLVAAFVAFVKFKALPNYSDVPVPEITISQDSLTLAKGKKLVDHICAGCHRPEGRQYAGGYFEDIVANKTFGEIYVPNITQSVENGVGDYSEGELYRLLRTGVNKEGKAILPVMPRYVLASEEDIHAMIAFLKSDDQAVQANETSQPVHKPSLLASALLNFAVKPFPYKDQYPDKPAITDKVAHGKYLVDAQMGCYLCHSASLQAWNLEEPELTPNYLGGGTEFVSEEGTVLSPSLLMDGQSNVSKWTEEEFIAAVRFGQRKGQPGYQKPMHPYPMMDSLEVSAMYAYLKDFSGK